jgi:dihydrofolate reductase
MRSASRCGHSKPDDRETTDEPMKLTTTTQVSVDGVMQGPGGRHENERGGFERGGWALGVFDNEALTFVHEIYQRADAFLFGRWTYELFASYWGVREDLENPIVGALNRQPKYVASNTLTEPRWANTTVLSGDVAASGPQLDGSLRHRALGGLRPRTHRTISWFASAKPTGSTSSSGPSRRVDVAEYGTIAPGRAGGVGPAVRRLSSRRHEL